MQSKTYEPCALYGIKELLAYASATFLVQPGPLQLTVHQLTALK